MDRARIADLTAAIDENTATVDTLAKEISALQAQVPTHGFFRVTRRESYV